MPTRSMAPSGSPSRRVRISCGIDEPMLRHVRGVRRGCRGVLIRNSTNAAARAAAGARRARGGGRSAARCCGEHHG
eukprot:7060022-Prymnesium_polylepis.1